MDLRHKHMCEFCKKEFEWTEFPRQHISEPLRVVSLDVPVGQTGKNGDSVVVRVRCPHCDERNEFEFNGEQ